MLRDFSLSQEPTTAFFRAERLEAHFTAGLCVRHLAYRSTKQLTKPVGEPIPRHHLLDNVIRCRGADLAPSSLRRMASALFRVSSVSSAHSLCRRSRSRSS